MFRRRRMPTAGPSRLPAHVKVSVLSSKSKSEDVQSPKSKASDPMHGGRRVAFTSGTEVGGIEDADRRALLSSPAFRNLQTELDSPRRRPRNSIPKILRKKHRILRKIRCANFGRLVLGPGWGDFGSERRSGKPSERGIEWVRSRDEP